jgi:hypothetical protein
LPARRRNRKTGRLKTRTAKVIIHSGKRKRSRKLPLPRRAKRLYVVAAEKKTRRRSRRRRKNPVMETPRRHHRRRRSNPVKHRRHHARRRHNPLNGGKDFMAGVFGLVVGGLLTTGALRFASTHALTGSAGAYQDAPANGQLYNAESPNAPVWSSWKTMLAGGLGVVLPFGVASFVKGPGAKTFWQLAGFGALAVVGVKLATDGIAKLTGKTMWGERLFAPEIMAQRDLATGVTPPAMAAPMLSGLPTSQPVRRIGSVPEQTVMQQQQPVTRVAAPAPAPTPPTPTPPPAASSPIPETNHRTERPFNWATDGLGQDSTVES